MGKAMLARGGLFPQVLSFFLARNANAIRARARLF